MRCWICLDENNLYRCCNCKNDFQLAHKYCIYQLSKSHSKCRFCNSNYKIGIYYVLLLKLVYIYHFFKKQFLVHKYLLDNIEPENFTINNLFS